MTSDAIPRPHPFSAAPGYGEDGRPDIDDTTAGTTPVYPEPDDPEPPDRPAPQAAAPAGLRAWWDAAVREGRTVPEAFAAPANLLEIWDYAKAAAFTTRTDGRGVVRVANRAWAVATMPFSALLLTALWALPRPARFVAFAVTLLLFGTVAARIPVLGWLVPPLLDVTAW